MSWNPALDPTCPDATDLDAIETLIIPRARDLGGFEGDHEDRGLYVVEGAVEFAGQRYEAGRMMVFRPGDAITLRAGPEGALIMALGGADDWAHGRFTLPPGDTDEYIPLP